MKIKSWFIRPLKFQKNPPPQSVIAQFSTLVPHWTNYFNYQYWLLKYQAIQATKNHQLAEDVIFEVQNLSASFEDSQYQTKPIIQNFSFRFQKNKIYCIVGKSGSGKTTLVTHFNGLMKPKVGNIYYANGTKIVFFKKKIRDYKKIRKLICLVFQSPENQLFKETVLKDVTFGPKVLGVNKKDILPNAIKQLLTLGLSEDFFNSNPFNLSGGQKRKVALAGILAIDPEVLVFDEPTAGLDPVSEQETIHLIANLKQQNKTVIMISHNMNHVLEIADEILLLDQGKLVEHCDVFSFFQKQALLAAHNIVLPHVFQVITQLAAINPIFHQLIRFQPRTANDLAAAIAHLLKQAT